MKSFLLLLILALMIPAPAAAVPPDTLSGSVCGSDLNGDGLVNTAEELVACVGGVCPHGAVACTTTHAEPLCPGTGTLNRDRNICEAAPTSADCPAGYVFDSAGNDCVQPVVCPDNGNLNASTDLCEKVVRNNCPAGSTYDAVGDTCQQPADCGAGVLNPVTDRCEKPAARLCPAGYLYNTATATCEAAPACVLGTYDPYIDQCKESFTPTCPTGYSYQTARDRCEKPPDSCPAGYSWDPVQDRCLAAPVCPAGSTAFNTRLDMCQQPAVKTCPGGYTYNAAKDRCETPFTCPAGTAYDPMSGNCLGSGNSTGGKSLMCAMGIEVKGAQIRAFIQSSVYYSAGAWVNLAGAGQSMARGAAGTNYHGLEVASGKIRYYLDGWGSWVDLNGSGTSRMSYYAIQVSAGQMRIVCYGTSSTWPGSWVQFLFSGSCPTGGTMDPVAKLCYTNFSYTCPTGSTLSGTDCLKPPTCPAGGTYNATLDKCSATAGVGICPSSSMDYANDVCFASAIATCPNGMVYDDVKKTCIAASTCAGTGRLNPAKDQCEATSTPDCAGWTMDAAADLCFAAPACATGAYEPTADQCLALAVKDCATYGWNPVSGRCEKAISSPAPGNYSTTLDGCAATAAITCPPAYTWNDSPVGACEATAFCAGDASYDSVTDGCSTGNNTCPLGDYLCGDIDGSGKKVCSANACVDFVANPPAAAPTDTTGFQNDGTVDQATGECSGIFKIFNGKGRECLARGWETSFFNCCDTDEDSWWFLREACPDQSRIAAQAIASGRAHFVGEYCRMDVWLIGCIQTANMYCVFNSKMARIVHEQGRRQLRKFGGGWGTPQSPNCRGFTPEEFQMLDFSKIDLSEIYGDITPLPAGQLQNDVQGAMDAFRNNMR